MRKQMIGKWHTVIVSVALVVSGQSMTAGGNTIVNVSQEKVLESDGYMRNGNSVVYRGKRVAEADPATFVDLGRGYGKDRYSVFYHGEILPYVDPVSFRLRDVDASSWDGSRRPHLGNLSSMTNGPLYVKDAFDVYFQGKKIHDATPNSFVELPDGYAKDAFNVYYLGKKLPGASSNSFMVLGCGYSRDAFNVYFNGKKVLGCASNSFVVLGGGYAKDAFNVYYIGKTLSGASSSSFQFKDGRAYDNRYRYNNGRRMRE